FTYRDAVVVDTPILLRAYRDRIREAHSLEDRLQRAMVFTEYLDTCATELGDDVDIAWEERSGSAKRLMERLHSKELAQRTANSQ
ncbi:MAG TPA: hypothetical protein VLJ11_14085, partial [Bryobacteraceae bacterium]|nr:hypothetical protein [Bryobacteraceae bacterium]